MNSAEQTSPVGGRSSAAELARALRARGAPATSEELAEIRSGLGGVHDPGQRVTAVHDYLHLLPASERGPAVVELLRSHDPYIREAVLDSGRELLGPAVLPAIAGLLDSADSSLRWHALEVIRQIGSATAIPLLIRGLHDEDLGNRWTASHGLIDLGGQALVPVLRALVQGPASIPFHRAVHRVLRSIGPADDSEMQRLLDALGHATSVVQAPPIAFALLSRLAPGA